MKKCSKCCFDIKYLNNISKCMKKSCKDNEKCNNKLISCYTKKYINF